MSHWIFEEKFASFTAITRHEGIGHRGNKASSSQCCFFYSVGCCSNYYGKIIFVYDIRKIQSEY